MRSIRLRLVLWLVGSALALMAVSGIGLYAYMDETLEHGLDAALAAKAEAIAGAVHMEDDGQPHLLLPDAGASGANGHEGPFSFQIWRADGRTLERVVPAAMGNSPLPRSADNHKRYINTRLADGTTARLTQISFLALPDEDEFDPQPGRAVHPREAMVLVLVHDRRSIDGPLKVLLSGLLLAASFMAGGILLIVNWGVRRGLRPLAEVSALAASIGPESLHMRFPVRDRLPAELFPIGLKLNELLDRLSAAFARERRFSAAVAHELRTPLAELRTACDVALRWPDDISGLRTALADARDVAVQMSTMVHTLLVLARHPSGAGLSLQIEPVNLPAALSDAWSKLDAVASVRGLTMNVEQGGEVVVAPADPWLLAAVLRNVLDNAIRYAAGGEPIQARFRPGADGRWSLHISNRSENISTADLPRFFEPFWRGDTTRTGGGVNVGLGLTLVKTYCDAMGVSVDFTLFSPGVVELTMIFPPCAGAHAALGNG